MKILRKIKLLTQRSFSRDIIPEEILKRFDIFKKLEELNKKGINAKVNIKIEDKGSEYQEEIRKANPKTKKDIVKLKNVIKDQLCILTNGSPEEDTHILMGASRSTSKFIEVSKSINSLDRLNYRVYEPKIEEEQIDDGETITVVSQKIVFSSIVGHNIGGQGNYLNNIPLRKRINKKRVIDPSTVKSTKKKKK